MTLLQDKTPSIYYINDTLFENSRIYPKEEQEYFKLQNQIWLYEKWKKRFNKQIPNLAARVFALREEFYRGCGFHYGTERKLGGIIYNLNNYDDTPQESKNMMMHRIVMQVAANGLFEDVVEAERSAKENGNDDSIKNRQTTR